jgi:hypothetical protein
MGSVSRSTERLAKSPKRKKLWKSRWDKYFIVRQRRRQMTLKVEARPQKECWLEARGAEGPRSRIITRCLDLGASPPLNGLIAPHLRPTPEDAVLDLGGQQSAYRFRATSGEFKSRSSDERISRRPTREVAAARGCNDPGFASVGRVDRSTMHSSRTRTAGEVGVGRAIGIGGTLPDRNQPGRSSRANTAQMVRREASQALGVQSFNAPITSAPLGAAGGFNGSTVAVAGTPSPRRGARSYRLEAVETRGNAHSAPLTLFRSEARENRSSSAL